MKIELHLFTTGSIITLILASIVANTSIVYGQSIFPKAQNATTSAISPSHAPTTAASTKHPSGNATSLVHKPRPSMVPDAIFSFDTF